MRPEDLLNKLFLFKGGSVRAEDVEFEGKTFEKGEKIYSTVDENKGIGVLISGKAVSLRVDGSRIRTLEKGDVYGAEIKASTRRLWLIQNASPLFFRISPL